MSDCGVFDARPDDLDALARDLDRRAETMRAAARILRDLRIAAVWQAPAGEAFAGLIGEVPTGLEQVALRWEGAATAISTWVPTLRDGQRRLREDGRALDDEDETVRRLEARERAIGPDHPDHDQVMTALARHRRLRESALRRFTRRAQGLLDSESPVVRRLDGLRDDGLADSWNYDLIEGVGTARDRVAPVAGVLTKVPYVGGAVITLGIAGTGSDLTRKITWDEGTWSGLGRKTLGHAADHVAPRLAGRALLRLKGPWKVRPGSINKPWLVIPATGSRRLTRHFGKIPEVKETRAILADWQAVAGGDRRTQALMAGALTIRTGRLVDRQVGRVETGRKRLAERRSRRKEGE